MQTAIAILAGLVMLVGIPLQLVLIFKGLSVLFQFFHKEKIGWFGLWGGWHIIVFAILFNYGMIPAQMEAFQQVAFQLEGLFMLGMYLCLPLLVSFLISRIHLYVRER